MDDNEAIIALIRERMAVGRERYGQGVCVDDDYDWMDMAMQELLDGCIYLAAAVIRHRRSRQQPFGQ